MVFYSDNDYGDRYCDLGFASLGTGIVIVLVSLTS